MRLRVESFTNTRRNTSTHKPTVTPARTSPRESAHVQTRNQPWCVHSLEGSYPILLPSPAATGAHVMLEEIADDRRGAATADVRTAACHPWAASRSAGGARLAMHRRRPHVSANHAAVGSTGTEMEATSCEAHASCAHVTRESAASRCIIHGTTGMGGMGTERGGGALGRTTSCKLGYLGVVGRQGGHISSRGGQRQI